MFHFKGHGLYSNMELAKAGVPMTGYTEVPYCGLYLSNATPKTEIYDLYIRTYDTAVPQPWFEANLPKIKREGGVVWSYDSARIFGEPVFWYDVFCQFGRDVKKAITDGEIKFEEVGNE